MSMFEVPAHLADRERGHVANHIRTLEQQTLDALLRIEEILDRAFPAPAKTVAEPVVAKKGRFSK
jgi:hypothetical protein